MAGRNNGSNIRRLRTNETATIDKGGTKRAHINTAATAYAIVMAKKTADTNVVANVSKQTKRKAYGNTRRVDINIVPTANKTAIACVDIIATNAGAGANIAVSANTNKAAGNIKECMTTYWQPQMPT